MSCKSIFILLLILLVFLLSLQGCASSQEEVGTQSPIENVPASPQESLPPTPAPRGAIIVKLSFSEPPVLNKPVEILATFALREGYKKDTTNTVARISLDEGFELLDGSLEWKGDLLHGSPVEIKATVRAIKTGERIISAKGKAPITSGYTELYAYVSEDSAEISDIPLGPKIEPPAQDVPPVKVP